jgi:hypothetical protein
VHSNYQSPTPIGGQGVGVENVDIIFDPVRGPGCHRKIQGSVGLTVTAASPGGEGRHPAGIQGKTVKPILLIHLGDPAISHDAHPSHQRKSGNKSHGKQLFCGIIFSPLSENTQ